MFKLMVAAPAPPEAEPHLRIGGLPLLPVTSVWPTCQECTGPMQFLAQVPMGESLLLLFQCQNQPGLCVEWEPGGGGNAALWVDGELRLAQPPELSAEQQARGLEGLTQLACCEGVDLEDNERSYFDAVTQPGARGQLGGEPHWIQDDETPTCPGCEQPMRLVVQLEASGGGGINFGDCGSGYAFACEGCREARFLWQCS